MGQGVQMSYVANKSITVLLEPDKEWKKEPALSAGNLHLGQVVYAATAAISPPQEFDQYQRFEAIREQLAYAEFMAAAQLLDSAETGFGGAFSLLPTYTMILFALEALARAGHATADSEELLRRIRHQARSEFIKFPIHGTIEWLVPAAPEDRTSAHVAALIFTRLGTLSRPWLWDTIPDKGRFLILGEQTGNKVLAAHHRCEGRLTFASVAHRLIYN
jgi:hypothetical protein